MHKKQKWWQRLLLLFLLFVAVDWQVGIELPNRPETQTVQWQEIVLRPFLRPVWDNLITKKTSHAWNLGYHGQVTHTVFVKGDKDAPDFSSWGLGPIGTIANVDFAWQTTVVLKPPEDHTVWYLGFKTGEAKWRLYNLKLTGAAGASIGPGDVEFFALDEGGKELQLAVVDRGTRDKVKVKVNYIL